MAFDKQKFKIEMKRVGVTQKQLAEMHGVQVRQVSRWLNSKDRLKSDKIAALCLSIGVAPEDFDNEWAGSIDTKNVARVSARVSSAAKNGYWILKRRYGVTETEICEIAPTLFALFAASIYEKNTSEQKQEAISAAMSDLGYMTADEVYGYNDHIDQQFEEKVQINLSKGKIFGDQELADEYSLRGYHEGHVNHFGAKISKFAEGYKNVKLSVHSTGEIPDGRGVAYDVNLTNQISGRDHEINDAIAYGEIELFSNEFEALQNQGERLQWLESRLVEVKKRQKERLELFYERYPHRREWFESSERETEREQFSRQRWELN